MKKLKTYKKLNLQTKFWQIFNSVEVTAKTIVRGLNESKNRILVKKNILKGMKSKNRLFYSIFRL